MENMKLGVVGLELGHWLVNTVVQEDGLTATAVALAIGKSIETGERVDVDC